MSSTLTDLMDLALHLALFVGTAILVAWNATRPEGSLLRRAILTTLAVWVVADFFVQPIVEPVMTTVFSDWLVSLDDALYQFGLLT